MAKILIVEDDLLFSSTLKDFLASQNHVVEAVHDGTLGLQYLQTYKYDLVILDWNLPGQSGPEILSHFKSQKDRSPVLILTARAQLEDKLRSFEVGADDYMTKPVTLQELAARVRALLRRSSTSPEKTLQYKDIAFQPASGRAMRGQRVIELTRKEAELLTALMQQPGEYLTSEALLERLWDGAGSRAGLANCLKRLRQQLNQDGEPDLIETVQGCGYRLK